MTHDLPATQGRPTASDKAADERFLRIDEVARRTGLTKRTLRYYEEMGLLAPAQRSEGNYRLYSESDIHTLEHIKAMRDLLGLELKEIRELAAAEMERERIRAQWRKDDDPARRLRALDDAEQVARRELALLEERLAGLSRMRQTLEERIARYNGLRAELETQVGQASARRLADTPTT
ncbi:MAG: MerR family transcriptional regulator [Ktedonobacterales bacterium]